jgi:hypothetical protein
MKYNLIRKLFNINFFLLIIQKFFKVYQYLYSHNLSIYQEEVAPPPEIPQLLEYEDPP